MYNSIRRNMRKIHLRDLTSSFQRAKIVSQFTSICSLIYHICIFILFFFLKIWPMFFYNILSISIFSLILFLIPKRKNFVGLYIIAAAEVITHQILADYFLGSTCDFHYFILLMGLLPFLVFEDRFRLSVPITIITTLLFVVYENLTILPKYEVADAITNIIKCFNIAITIFVVLSMILIYTLIVFRIEKNLETQKSALEKEIKLASVIQQNFFKQDISSIGDWDIGYFSKPMVGVSGDLLDFYKKDGILRGLGIFDVSGHGISSGLVTMLVKNIIFQEFYKKQSQDEEVWEILNRINDRVIEEKGDIANYLTGILVRVKDNNLEFANAGHPSPLYYSSVTHQCKFIEKPVTTKGAIGLPGFPTFYESQFLDLAIGDEFVLYSDGVLDLKNEKGETFGKERLLNLVRENIDVGAKEQIEYISQNIYNFCGNIQQNDDITVIILKK